MEWLNSLDKVATLSASALVFCCCIVMGYSLRIIKKFPNDGIPIAVILTGAISMLLLANVNPAIPVRTWVTRHIIAGFVIGFVSWIAHKTVISKLEDWLATKFDVVANLLHIETSDGKVVDQPPTPDKKP